MPRQVEQENRSGPRYLASLEVKAEWDEPSGTHVVAEGTTENVGPEGTLVHLPRHLPDVGSRVRLEVLGETGEKLQVIAEVLRIERDDLASLLDEIPALRETMDVTAARHTPIVDTST